MTNRTPVQWHAKSWHEGTIIDHDGCTVAFGVSPAAMPVVIAAPEMLEALKSISHQYENQDFNHVDFRVWAKRVADAAIAKAKGRPSQPIDVMLTAIGGRRG